MTDDVATFIAHLELPDGEPLELAPFQARLLDALGDFTIPSSGELMLAARRAEKRERAAEAIVVALLAGGKVAICAPDASQARDTLERAADILQRNADLFGVELPAPAAKLIHTDPRP